jgi:hypothetical protein
MASSDHGAGVITAMAVSGKRRRIIRAFEEHQAESAASARALSDLGLSESRFVKRLQEAGVLAVTGDRRYYLNRERWSEYSSSRRRRAWIILTLCGVLILVYLLMQRS